MASQYVLIEGNFVDVFEQPARRMLSFHDGHRWPVVQSVLAAPAAIQARFAGWKKAAIRISVTTAVELIDCNTLTHQELLRARDEVDGGMPVIVIDNVQSLHEVADKMLPKQAHVRRFIYGRGGFQLQIVDAKIPVTQAPVL